MSSRIPDHDTHELLGNMEDEDLRSFAATFEGDSDTSDGSEESKTLLYAVRHALFLRTKTSEDLDEVIRTAELALSPTLDATETRAQMSEEASGLLSIKFERTLAEEDLLRAIYWIQKSIEITPEDSVYFVPRMTSLTDLLDKQDRYGHINSNTEGKAGDRIWNNLDKIILTQESDSKFPTAPNTYQNLPVSQKYKDTACLTTV
jgi:hypothetical protein